MTKIPNDDFVKNLVRLLLQSEMEAADNPMIQIDYKTFNQIVLYILRKEVLDVDKEVIEAHLLLQLDEIMGDIHKELEGVLALLKEKG